MADLKLPEPLKERDVRQTEKGGWRCGKSTAHTRISFLEEESDTEPELQTRQEPLQQSWGLVMSGPKLWAEQTLYIGVLSVLWNSHPSILRFSGQRLKTEDAPKIHVSLSVSLFLLNLTFFINMGHGAPDSSAACRARGAIFHYYLLCTFTWMSLEAFHLYLLVIKVFNTYISHYFLKLSLVGWGRQGCGKVGRGIACGMSGGRTRTGPQ